MSRGRSDHERGNACELELVLLQRAVVNLTRDPGRVLTISRSLAYQAAATSCPPSAAHRTAYQKAGGDRLVVEGPELITT